MLGIGNNTAALCLGLVHQTVGMAHGHLNRATSCHGCTYADGDMNLRVIRHHGLRNLGSNLTQALTQNVRANAGEYQQKLIAARAYNKVALAHSLTQGVDGGLECFVAHMVAACIVYQLKVVDVDNSDASVDVLTAQVVLVVATVIHAGKRIAVQQVALVLCVGRNVERLRVQNHARLALNFNVARGSHVMLIAHQEHLSNILAIVEHLLAHHAHAGAVRTVEQAERIALERVHIKHAHHGIQIAVALELLFGLKQCEIYRSSIFVSLFGYSLSTHLSADFARPVHARDGLVNVTARIHARAQTHLVICGFIGHRVPPSSNCSTCAKTNPTGSIVTRVFYRNATRHALRSHR